MSSSLFSSDCLWDILFFIVSNDTDNFRTRSIFFPCLLNKSCSVLAWFKFLGYPSKINLLLYFLSEIKVSTNFLTILSETNDPELMIDEISFPNSVLSLISFLRISPVDNWNKSYFLL